MHETEERVPSTPYRSRLWLGGLFGLGCLVAGVVIGRAFFPLEVPKPFIVEKEKRVEVPVDRVVEKTVPVEVIKYVDRVVERRVEVPFEVVKYVDRTVESDRTPQVPFPKATTVSSTAIDAASWKKLSVGMSPESVRNLLGTPELVGGSSFFYQWYYDDNSWLSFVDGKLHDWSKPSR